MCVTFALEFILTSYLVVNFIYFRPSPILLAIGVPESIAKNALRLSIGRETTLDNIDCIIQDLLQAVNEIENNKELN